jgi:hypothetical protein
MVTHVLLLLPGLCASGWLAGHALALRYPTLLAVSWNRGGASGLVTAGFTTAFWMLPRSIDWSLTDPLGELAKYGTLPILVGIALVWSWGRVPELARGIVKANVLSMLLVLSWVYSVAPVRLCNSYGVGQQETLGIGFLFVACCLACLWTAPLFGARLMISSSKLCPSLDR